MNMPKKFLIAGGGLAGSFMAAALCRAGYSVTLCHRESPAAATPVAAGLFNVITGRLAAKTWMAEEFLAHLEAFFSAPPFDQLQQHLHYTRIYRPFRGVQDYNDWTAKRTDPGYHALVELREQPLMPEALHNEQGGLWILPCGWADAEQLCRALRSLLAREYDFTEIEGHLDLSQTQPEKGIARTGDREIRFDELVCCEGVAVLDNPLFKGIDIRPLKGQIMDVEIEGLETDFVISKKVYLIPRGKGIFTVGGTYEPRFSDPFPNTDGTESLSELLKILTPLPFRVLETRAGVRATTPNRRPVLGTHPDFPNLHIFNGLGTKGMLQAPFFASKFAQYIEGNYDIIKDIHPRRLFTKKT